MPTIAKNPDGSYRSRELSLPYRETTRIRRAMLTALITEFRPDLLIVDKVARGAAGELEPALERLAGQDGRAVLGLREILDDPARTIREWRDDRTTEAIGDYYDAVWVYGDPRVYDARTEYRLPESVTRKIDFTGYLSRGRARGLMTGQTFPPIGSRPFVACLIGGGQDGDELATAFADTELPDDHLGVLVCGPYLSPDRRRRLRRIAATRQDLTVIDTVPGAELIIDQAAAVVSMAGYNTVCEILATATPALLVPRVRPRQEQLIRAGRLAGYGLVDLEPPELLTTERIGEWLRSAVAGSAQADLRESTGIRLDGLSRIPGLVDDLIRVDDHAA